MPRARRGDGAEPGVVAARTAVAVVFALNGLGFATWVSRTPAVRVELGLTPGQLGLLLLTMAAGAVLSLPLAGSLTRRVGAARAVAGGAVLVGVGLLLAGAGTSLWGHAAPVAAGLFCIGYGSGTWDVAMNLEGATVERRLRRTVMPRFHAAFSVGSVVGAVLGAGAAAAGLPVLVHLGLGALVCVAAVARSVGSFLPASRPAGTAAPDPGEPRELPVGRMRGIDAWREPRTLLVGLLVLVMAFTEGTANDWLAVAFVDGYGVSEATGALTFGVFVAAMTVGRTVGTTALDRWGRVPVLVATMLTAAGGGLLAVLAGVLPLALLGVALWGLGTSLGFPVGMSAAADDEAHAGPRVSVVATIGYAAFLAGPPLVGFLGDRVGVLQALLAVPVLVLPALFLVPALRPPQAATGATATAPGYRDRP